ncbi:alpha/beta fold hydrolase [Bradyrhizobium diazoefficiens]|nr:alpha/beta fold hydrolase [Bradyrhizobium diazoefficiens]MBR0851735.1 alpha/beta fold hydrolase [Bradyrhizobium diazoefficiens]
MHPTGRTAASLRVATAVLMALACCSCTSRSLQGMLVPTSEAVDAGSQVAVLVATTRMRSSGDPGEMFGREPSSEMAFGQVTVSIPPDNARNVGEIQWPSSPPGDPRRDFVTASAGYLDRAGFIAAVSNAAKTRRRSKAMIFVHGFNNRFDDAVYRFAQFVQDGRLPVAPVLYSWPSQGAGNLGSYEHDRKVAAQSSAALVELLDTVNANPAIREITLVCHSMGCMVALDALHMKASRGGTASKLKNVAFVAPDVAFEQFIREVGELGPRRPRIALFVSQDDAALKISKSLAGGQIRAGDINPEQDPYKGALAQQKIFAFDLTRFGGEDSHSRAFDEVGSVMGMLERRLAQGQQLGDDAARTR